MAKGPDKLYYAAVQFEKAWNTDNVERGLDSIGKAADALMPVWEATLVLGPKASKPSSLRGKKVKSQSQIDDAAPATTPPSPEVAVDPKYQRYASSDQLPAVQPEHIRVYRGTLHPDAPQVGAKYRSNPHAAPEPSNPLSTAEARQHVANVNPIPRAVSAGTDIGSAMRYPTPSHGAVVVYDIPQSFMDSFAAAGDAGLSEWIFPNRIPDEFRRGVLTK